MRLIDADEAKKQIKLMQTLSVSEILLFQLALDRTPTYEPPNPPLTLEELREMDGEPVWISGEGIGCYDVCCGISSDGMVQFYRPALPADSYGKAWLAYRRKPEEETT